jgi:phage shock protein A
MAILERFNDIIRANINDRLDKMEDPSELIDQCLLELMEDLAEVKAGTAEVMAEEMRTRKEADENQAEAAKYMEYAKKALLAGNDADARIFIKRKQELEAEGTGLMANYTSAHENAMKIRQLHDKLTSDIEALKSRRALVKAKLAVANAQMTLNDATDRNGNARSAGAALERMEEEAQRKQDEASAMAQLNEEPKSGLEALEEKYSAKNRDTVDAEMAKIKAQLGL